MSPNFLRLPPNLSPNFHCFHQEILNAGGLYGNARPENFPSVNDYRNPLVASAMKTLGYISRTGSPRSGKWEVIITYNCVIEIV